MNYCERLFKEFSEQCFACLLKMNKNEQLLVSSDKIYLK